MQVIFIVSVSWCSGAAWSRPPIMSSIGKAFFCHGDDSGVLPLGFESLIGTNWMPMTGLAAEELDGDPLFQVIIYLDRFPTGYEPIVGTLKAYLDSFQDDVRYFDGDFLDISTVMELGEDMPEWCSEVQVSLQRKPLARNDKWYLVNRRVWGLMKSYEQAAHILMMILSRHSQEHQVEASFIWVSYLAQILILDRARNVSVTRFSEIATAAGMR